MKNQIKLQILAVTATLVMASQAHAGCPIRQDVVESTKALSQYLKDRSGFMKVSLDSKESPTFRLDRDNSDFPEYKALEGDGTVASKKGITVEKIKNGEAAFARVIAITKCHSLTNLHVVNALAKEQGQKEVSNQTTVYASYGQGKSCENSFKEPDRVGRVVGFNSNAFYYDEKLGHTAIHSNLDYAVIAHSEPLKLVAPVKVSREGLLVGDKAIRVGQSAYDFDGGFQFTPVDVVQGASGSTNGMVSITNQKEYPGRSGGGIYVQTTDGWQVAAIYVGGRAVLNVSAILRDIHDNNPALYQDIVRVKNGGACSQTL